MTLHTTPTTNPTSAATPLAPSTTPTGAKPAIAALMRRAALGAGALAASAAMLGGLAPAASAAAGEQPQEGAAAEASAGKPSFQVPFPCGETWTASTRTDHRPVEAVDFQHSPADGWKVFASAPGTVKSVKDSGGKSYGKYIVIDHGGGWQTLYAHLKTQEVKVGQKVDAKTFIGRVGSTGGSTGPHLHYEQKLNGTVKQAEFASGKAQYPSGKVGLGRTAECPSDPGQR